MAIALRSVERELWQRPERPRYWGDNVEAPRGAYGGLCFRAACGRHNAHWLNDMNGRYYCAECARQLNESSRRPGPRALCELRL